MKNLLLFMLLAVCGRSYASTYYMATTGSDANAGTISSPVKTLEKLTSLLRSGDIGYIRGGVYQSTAGNAASAVFRIQGLTGTATSPITIAAYPGEVPVLDCSNIAPTYAYPYALYFQGNNYVHLKGHIILKNLKQIANGSGISRGFVSNGSNNCTIEFLEVYNMGGTAFSLSSSNNNTILNSDFHHNGDGLTVNTDGSSDSWDNADGWSDTGGDQSTGNTFDGCRMYMNSDDGCDFFDWNGNLVTVKNCWSFWNGIKPWGPTARSFTTESEMTPGNPALFFGTSASQRAYQSNGSAGEGFKAGGGSQAGRPTTLTKRYWNNVAFENVGSGFPGNALAGNSQQYQYYNCAAYRNGRDGFAYAAGWATGIAHYFKNCWAWGNSQFNSIDKDWAYDGLSTNVSNNVWMSTYNNINYGNLTPSVAISNADFQSVSSIGVDGARQSDGSLPNLPFLKLATGSRLINAGMNVGLSYMSTAPDIGAFESTGASSTNISPTANAGADKTIVLPTNSVSLTGTGTDPDGSITTYAWTKVAGPTAGTITTATTATTTVSGLTQGIYTFLLKVTDNLGATGSDSIVVNVNAATSNRAPVANAGTDKTITLPVNSSTLTGTGTDSDGTIAGYQWTKVSGPATGVITTPTAATTTLTGLVQGVYQWELKVTDNLGAVGRDTVVTTVNPASTVVSKKIRINIYSTTPYSNASWNNWKPITAAYSSSLKYEDGTASAVTVMFTKQSKIQDNGSTYLSTATICPPQVLRYASANQGTRTITAKGLSTSKKYTLEFYASSSVNGNKTIFSLGSTSYTITTDNNKTAVAKFINITPNILGMISITMNSTSSWNYLNGFVITEQSGTVTAKEMTDSTGLQSETETKTTVSIFPLPFSTSFTVSLYGEANGTYDLTLVDFFGKPVLNKKVNKTNPTVNETIYMGNLQPGTYILQVISPDQKKTAYPIIKN